MAHAVTSPSSAERWVNCPGSVRLSAHLPRRSSEAADEGTACHEYVACAIDAGTFDAAALPVVEVEGVAYPLTPDRAAAVQMCLDVAFELSTFAELLLVEQAVELSAQVYGTADLLVLVGDTLHVVDWKFGGGHLVTLEGEPGNRQLLAYAAGALRDPRFAAVKHVVLHVVQPRRPDADGGAHRHRSYTADQVRDIGRELVAAADATAGPNAPLQPGSWCTFCPAKATCPAIEAEALSAARAVFAVDVAVPKPPAPRTLDAETIAAVLDKAPILRDWLDGIEHEATQRLKGGERIPGYKLVERIGNRRWKDEEQAITELRRAGVDALVHKCISPAQADKAGGKKVAALVTSLTERPVTGVALVTDSDKRPAIGGASDAFAAVALPE